MAGKSKKMLDVIGLNVEDGFKVQVPSSVRVQFRRSCRDRGMSVEERLQYLIYADSLGLIDDEKIQSVVMSGMKILAKGAIVTPGVVGDDDMDCERIDGLKGGSNDG